MLTKICCIFYNDIYFSSENGKVTSVEAEPNLDNKDYKKTLKLTWLCDTDQAKFTPCYSVYFEHIISKGVLAKDEDFKKYIGHETRVIKSVDETY